MTDCNIHVESHRSAPTIKWRKQQKVSIDVWPEGNQTVPACKEGTTIGDMFPTDDGSGVMFCTYNLLRAGTEKQLPERKEEPEGYMRRVIAALENPKTRFTQILEWLQVCCETSYLHTCMW